MSDMNATIVELEKAIIEVNCKLKAAIAPSSRERLSGELAGLRRALKIVKETESK